MHARKLVTKRTSQDWDVQVVPAHCDSPHISRLSARTGPELGLFRPLPLSGSDYTTACIYLSRQRRRQGTEPAGDPHHTASALLTSGLRKSAMGQQMLKSKINAIYFQFRHLMSDSHPHALCTGLGITSGHGGGFHKPNGIFTSAPTLFPKRRNRPGKLQSIMSLTAHHIYTHTHISSHRHMLTHTHTHFLHPPPRCGVVRRDRLQ